MHVSNGCSVIASPILLRLTWLCSGRWLCIPLLAAAAATERPGAMRHIKHKITAYVLITVEVFLLQLIVAVFEAFVMGFFLSYFLFTSVLYINRTFWPKSYASLCPSWRFHMWMFGDSRSCLQTHRCGFFCSLGSTHFAPIRWLCTTILCFNDFSLS
jgi:hypothetical protein